MGSHDVIAVLFATLRLGLVMPFICSNLPFRGELQRTPNCETDALGYGCFRGI